MTVLLDTNILTRLALPTHPKHATARDAVAALQRSGETLRLVPQNCYEFWVVATRPIAANGLGFTAPQADAELTRFEGLFPLLTDTPALCAEWRRLVVASSVLGKNAHDARLVAAMLTHGVTHLLTFNVADFTRFTGITVLDPNTIAIPPTP